MSQYEGLTDEEVARETALLEGVPLLNVGALFLPPVWGPAHGQWWTIVWYPLWMLADNLFYLAYSQPSGLSVSLAVLVGLALAAFTVIYARLSQPFGLHRALDKKHVTKARYLEVERRWAIVSVAVGIVLIALATYYNLAVRPALA
jgi:hypothetical protein